MTAPPLLLTIRVRFRGEATAVEFTLDTGAGNAAGTWEVPYALFVAPAGNGYQALSRLPTLRVPIAVAAELSRRLTEQVAPPGKPLWLRFARPYGVLGVAPYEAALSPALARPIYRLSDFPDRPLERPDVFESAVVVDAGPDADPADVARRAGEVARAVLKGSSRPSTAVHVFAHRRVFAALAPLMKDGRITVHDPADAPAEILEVATLPVLPVLPQRWIDWVLACLGERPLDAVHLVTRARWGEGGGGVLISDAPSGPDGALVMVDPEELRLIVGRVGAWALSFTPSVPACRADMAFVADYFAHLRPGAVLFNPGDDGNEVARLDRCCRLLFTATPTPPPTVAGGFVYCHPSFASGEESVGASLRAGLLDALGLLLPGGRPASSPSATTLYGQPSWVAALHRSFEDAAAQAVRRAGDDALLSQVEPVQGTMSNEAVATLNGMQSVLKSYLEPKAED